MKTILLIENGSRHTVALSHHLKPYIVRRVKYKNLSPQAIESADIIILSGGHPSVLHHYWFYRKQIELIRSTAKPVIGVCLGFELIIRAYGGSLYKTKKKIHGVRIIRVVIDSLDLATSSLKVWEAHKWAAKTMPVAFDVIADSASGPEIIQHKSKLIFGCQFHPEVNKSNNDGSIILNAILFRINSAVEQL